MRRQNWILALVVLLVLVVLVGIAGSFARRLQRETAAIWTPQPITPAPTQPMINGAILPTLPVTPAGPAAPPAPTRPATRPPPSAPPASPTADRNVITVTEADVIRAVAAGVGGQEGLVLQGLTVRFAQGKMRLAADRVQYGVVDVQDLVLVGRLSARDGRLQLETESISPRGLVTALIPTLANQALAQYAAQWYVEEVRTLDGRLELKIRQVRHG